MAEPFSPEISDRICNHMNEDHAEAITLYAKTFGKSPDTEAAKMDSIDAQGMNLTAQIDSTKVPLRIEFDRTLQDAEDAHHTLIDMVKQAKTILKGS